MPETRPCKACGAPIIFAPTGETKSDGKPVVVPLDARKHNIYSINKDGNAVRADESYKISHWATCPGTREIKAMQQEQKTVEVKGQSSFLE